MLQSKHCMGLNWMAKKSKLNKHVHEKKVAAVDVVGEVIGHTGLEALDEEVDLEVAEEMTVEVEEVETAITAISQGIWHEIAEKNVEKEVVAEVDSEVVEEVEATERATIAIKKDTWQENAQKETAEIVRNSEET